MGGEPPGLTGGADTDMRIAVTGASSLIGTALVELLRARGDDVVAFQRGRTRSPAVARVAGPNVETHLGDVSDAAAVDAALERCEVVVHLAAKVGVVGPREEYVRTNIDGTRNVIAAARRHGARGVVHVSSPSVAHDGTPIVGGAAPPPLDDHGVAWYPATKAVAEKLALETCPNFLFTDAAIGTRALAPARTLTLTLTLPESCPNPGPKPTPKPCAKPSPAPEQGTSTG